MTTAEDIASGILTRLGVEKPHFYSSGDLVELANLVAANSWTVIEGSDTLPQTEDMVLFVQTKPDGEKSVWHGSCWQDGAAPYWTSEDGCPVENVTHWRPEPELPK